mmetsp:Transcript_853/g.2542  ORF Transcript_853/g.2542 Transcript_853/m.2542 type:complete len:356 (+) Transcript_853:289-1356(+)
MSTWKLAVSTGARRRLLRLRRRWAPRLAVAVRRAVPPRWQAPARRGQEMRRRSARAVRTRRRPSLSALSAPTPPTTLSEEAVDSAVAAAAAASAAAALAAACRRRPRRLRPSIRPSRRRRPRPTSPSRRARRIAPTRSCLPFGWTCARASTPTRRVSSIWCSIRRGTLAITARTSGRPSTRRIASFAPAPPTTSATRSGCSTGSSRGCTRRPTCTSRATTTRPPSARGGRTGNPTCHTFAASSTATLRGLRTCTLHSSSCCAPSRAPPPTSPRTRTWRESLRPKTRRPPRWCSACLIPRSSARALPLSPPLTRACSSASSRPRGGRSRSSSSPSSTTSRPCSIASLAKSAGCTPR